MTLPTVGAIGTAGSAPPTPAKPKRFHGTELLGAAPVGRDASRTAQDVISHLSGLVGGFVRVTIEIEADNPDGASDQIVRIMIENSQTLKFWTMDLKKLNRLSQP